MKSNRLDSGTVLVIDDGDEVISTFTQFACYPKDRVEGQAELVSFIEARGAHAGLASIGLGK